MEHGNPGAYPDVRADTDCLAPPTASLPLIGIAYTGAPVAMACKKADRKDGTENPAIRYFGCYWSRPPDGN